MPIEHKYSFEDYLSKANNATTKEELFSIYTQTVMQHGLDRVLLCLATDHRDINETAGMKFLHNYPQHWMDHYFEHEFDKIDPVIIYGFHKYDSFSWDEVSKRMKLTRLQQNCLDQGIESGLNHGICTPLRGSNNAIAGLSLASTEKKDSFDGNKDLITAYSNHFYIAYRRLGLQSKGSESENILNHALNQKERDILSWMAKGKSYNDIADILCLSRHTVDYHVRNIYNKLGVNHATLAIVKAISYGLIEP